jgi:RHS repeat-associated protein
MSEQEDIPPMKPVQAPRRRGRGLSWSRSGSQNPYAFHQGVKDVTSGLVHFGTRWYDPTTGTWTQQDTPTVRWIPPTPTGTPTPATTPINQQDPGGQGVCADTAEALGAVSFGLAVGAIALAPFTGGFSLPLVAGALGSLSVATGAPTAIFLPLTFAGECS